MSRKTVGRFARPSLRSLIATSLALCAVLAGPAHADVLHLEGGRRVVGRIVSRDTDAVTIRAYGGDVRVPRARIVRIEGDDPPPDIEALVRTHRRALRPGDVTGALRLADLARDHSLPDEEGELLMLAAAWRPGSDELRSRLGEWRRTSRRLPATATALAGLRREFAAPCEVLRTRRYAIAHDVSPAAAERAGEALERTWSRLHELGDALAIDLRPPESALPVHVRAGHSHWSGFLEVVDELFDTNDELRLGVAPVAVRDGSRHVETCELVVALRAAQDALEERRTALGDAVEELKAFRATVQAVRDAGESLWVSDTRQAGDVAGRLFDRDRRARTSLTAALEDTGRLLDELPRVHAVAAGQYAPPLADGGAWRVLRHESVAGERLMSRLERLESAVSARFDEGAALGGDDLDALERRLTAILDLAVPHGLLLRDRAKAAAGLRTGAAESLAVSDRVSLTRAAARQLALETRLLTRDAPTWLAEGVSALIETGGGESDFLAGDADVAARALGEAWRRAPASPGGELARLIGGDAFRSDFARARLDAVALLRQLVEHHPVETGSYITDLRAGRVAAADAAAFERRFGPVAELLPAPPTDD